MDKRRRLAHSRCVPLYSQPAGATKHSFHNSISDALKQLDRYTEAGVISAKHTLAGRVPAFIPSASRFLSASPCFP